MAKFTKNWKTGDKCKVRCADNKWHKGKVVWGTPGQDFFQVVVKKKRLNAVASWTQIKKRKKRKNVVRSAEEIKQGNDKAEKSRGKT